MVKAIERRICGVKMEKRLEFRRFWHFRMQFMQAKRKRQKKCKTIQVKNGRRKTGAGQTKAEQKEIHKNSLFALFEMGKTNFHRSLKNRGTGGRSYR